MQYLRKDNQAEAINELQKAVDIYPNYATAWYELGQAQEQYAAAKCGAHPLPMPLPRTPNSSARIWGWPSWRQVRKLGRASRITDRLLKLDAVDYPIAYFYNATANLDLGRLDAAEDSARAGLKLDTPHLIRSWNNCWRPLWRGREDYAGAAEHLRNYLALAPDAGGRGAVEEGPSPNWSGYRVKAGQASRAKAPAQRPRGS